MRNCYVYEMYVSKSLICFEFGKNGSRRGGKNVRNNNNIMGVKGSGSGGEDILTLFCGGND